MKRGIVKIALMAATVIFNEPKLSHAQFYDNLLAFIPDQNVNNYLNHDLSRRRKKVFENDKIFMVDEKLINWLKTNVSPQTSLPYSFQIMPSDREAVYGNMGDSHSVDAIIERIIVEEGLVVYDGAVGQIVLALIGGEENLEKAQLPIEVYWRGHLGELANLRAGYKDQSFIYDPENPEVVSSDLSHKGRRGFIFRIINADGKYQTRDPLDGKTEMKNFPTWSKIHWEDWKPVAGENAWIVMAALHIYHQKYYDPETGQYTLNPESIELQLAQELARAALFLQAENGGIRMAPLGTYRSPSDLAEDKQSQGAWWYNQISSENNISWYAAFRMLYDITQISEYKDAMNGIESYFQLVWNPEEKYFYQGLNYTDGKWQTNKKHFALDVQTWSIAAFGPEKIDDWFGKGSAYQMWRVSKQYSGCFARDQKLLGVGFTQENDRVSVEWTAGAILATSEMASYYEGINGNWKRQLLRDTNEMREGIEFLKKNISPSQAAYSYSSRRGWIPFGWNSHSPEVLSLASTGWVAMVDAQINPFYLPVKSAQENFTVLSAAR